MQKKTKKTPKTILTNISIYYRKIVAAFKPKCARDFLRKLRLAFTLHGFLVVQGTHKLDGPDHIGLKILVNAFGIAA